MAIFRAFSLLVLFCCGAALADDYNAVTQLMRSGKLNEAQVLADQYLVNKPRDPQMRFLKGVIQRDSGKTAEAITTFTRLTEDYPELPEPYNNLAVLYASQNQFDKARLALEMAIRTNPSYATAHENLGDVYAKLAGQAYNKALQLDSSNTAVTPKLALVRELFNPSPRRTDMPGNEPAVPSAPVAPPAPTRSAPAVTAPAYTAPAAGLATAPLAPMPAAPARSGVVELASASAPMVLESSSRSPAVATDKASAAAEVDAAVRAWAAAWSDKDVRAYLAAYGRDFVPPNGLSRSEWESKRDSLIATKRAISVKLSKVKVSVNGNQATAQFVQDYKADKVVSVKQKTLWLAKAGGRWLIVKES